MRSAMRHGSLRAALTFVALALALVLATAPVRADDRITSFTAELALNADGSVDVVETIEVEADGTVIKHGIFRNIVTSQSALQSKLTVTRVERDGVAEPYAIEPTGDVSRVRIGDADVLIDPGRHTYVLGYHLTNAAIPKGGRLKLLAWQVIGNWPFAIESAKAAVTLQPGVTLIGANGYASTDAGNTNVTAEASDSRLQFNPGTTADPTSMWIYILFDGSPFGGNQV